MSASSASLSARGAVVVGGGIVGLSTALLLQRDGWQVSLVEPEAPGPHAASFGNAGLIASHIVYPIAVRSILPKLPRMLLDETAPLAIRWRHLPTVAPWLLRLLRATDPREVERIAKALASELKHAADAFAPLLEASGTGNLMGRDGILVAYPDAASLAENNAVLDLQRRNGVPFTRMEAEELRAEVPEIAPRYRLAIRYPQAGHVSDPLALLEGFRNTFLRLGGTLIPRRATGFRFAGDKVSAVETEGAAVPADLVVIAAGIWSRPLAAQLGFNVPLESERGYHLTLPTPGIALKHAMMIGDIRFAVTPMRMGLRIAGTIEFAGLAAPPNPRRHDALLANARRVFPGLTDAGATRWMGHRPSLPDSLPVIGPSPRQSNVLFNFGHGHLGLTSAAITAQAVADVAAGRQPPFSLAPFRVDRF